MTMLQLQQEEPMRDRWGRPLKDGTPYTRASTIAKSISDQSALMKWGQRMAMLGVARNEDLIAAVATTDPSDSRTLNGIAEQALERAQATAARTTGTAIHAATEMADRGEDISHLPESIRRDVKAYRDVIDDHGLTPVLGEVFVVNDELEVAGTFDRVLRSSAGGFGVGDIKTSGSVDTAKYAALEWAIQIAIYSRSTPWCAKRGYITWEELGLTPPSTDAGVVVHVVQGTGRARLYQIDLQAGWDLAQLAAKVRKARKYGPTLARAM